jgi:Epoxide hydrolase N terminus
MQPFQIAIAQRELDALKRRLAETRWPSASTIGRWELGPDEGFMRRLVAYWIDNFNWRAQQRRINRFAQFQADIDGHRLHFLHETASAAGARPLLLMHGWPNSFVSFLGHRRPAYQSRALWRQPGRRLPCRVSVLARFRLFGEAVRAACLS